MFETLAAAIDEVDAAVDGDEIRALLALRSRLEAKVARAVAAFEASGMWGDDGSVSITSWLRAAGLATGDAARLAHVAKRIARLPSTAAAWEEGALTSGQVAAIATTVTAETADRFARDEAALLPALARLDVTDVRRALREWQARAIAEAECDGELADLDLRERSVHVSPVGDRWRVDGDLDAESGSIVSTALRLASTVDVPGEPVRGPAQRRADALVDVCRHYLDHQRERTGGRHRPHLNVVVDLDAFERRVGGAILDGPMLGPATIARLLCDCGVHRVVTDGRSAILDYGTTTRTIPAPLWNALVVRDEHCRFPGCDRTPSWCEGHHVRHFSHGGPTNLGNLVLLCSRHHHLVHTHGWHVKLLPDATLEVTSPDGTTRTSRPPGTVALL